MEDLKPEIGWGTPEPFTRITRFFNGRYVMEVKHDGCQVTVVLGDEANLILSRGRDVSDHFPHLQSAIVPGAAGTVLAGELIANGKRGQLLCSATALLVASTHKALAQQKTYGPAQVVLFDVLGLAATLPLEGPVPSQDYQTRRKILETVHSFMDEDAFALVRQMPSCKESIQAVLDAGGEGVVIKRLDAVNDWYKIKRYSTADAFITGWKPGEGSNAGLVGSVALSVLVPVTDRHTLVTLAKPGGLVRGRYLNHGGKWLEAVEVASVGNFGSEKERRKITGEDGRLRPEYYGRVIEFIGQAIGVNGRVRHPNFIRWRLDKTPIDCTAEQLKIFSRA
jgi:bifunctional non-homologous end joining protein LigD